MLQELELLVDVLVLVEPGLASQMREIKAERLAERSGEAGRERETETEIETEMETEIDRH